MKITKESAAEFGRKQFMEDLSECGEEVRANPLIVASKQLEYKRVPKVLFAEYLEGYLEAARNASAEHH